jgi:hypothetical protein
VAVVVPSWAPTGPGSLQLVNRPGGLASNAVAAVIGATPTITGVVVSGSLVAVTRTGSSTLSVINLFAKLRGVLVNVGGLGPAGPRSPLSVVGDTRLTFTRPIGVDEGPAFVEVLNPPFTPFSTSGSDPDGAFTYPAPDTRFTFVRPAGALAGPAFVEVLNPPFIPFASSGSDPDGAFTMP